jgi:Mg/Co/Ni transporter MgtE
VNDYDKLVGVLSLRTLVLAQSTTKLHDVMFDDDLTTALPDEPEANVADDISKYNLLAIPVVNEHGRMLGIVTFDDALDVIEEDAEDTKSSSNTARGVLLAIGGILFLIIYTLVVLQIVGFKG